MKVLAVYIDEDKVRCAGPGENLRIRLSGIEEDDILSGFVLCSVGKFHGMKLDRMFCMAWFYTSTVNCMWVLYKA